MSILWVFCGYSVGILWVLYEYSVGILVGSLVGIFVF